MNKHTYYLLSQINYGYNRQFIYIDIKEIKSVILLCKFLKKEGIISFFILFSKKKSKFIRIFLNNDYIDEFTYSNLKQFFFLNLSMNLNYLTVSGSKPYNFMVINSKPSHLKYLKLSELKKISSLNRLLILSTNLGYLSDKDAIALGVGGILMCTINL